MRSMDNKQHYAPNHPVVLWLNSHLAKLLVVQLLSYHLVESTALKQLIKCVQPRWWIPSCQYFCKKAVPTLHNYVKKMCHSNIL